MIERKRSILLVDDYPDTLEMWALYLEINGYTVTISSDGLQAVELAGRLLPDLIVLDVDLPGISGIEAATRLKSGQSTARIPLIAATGHSHLPLDSLRSCGFEAILVKPCPPAILTSEIERILSGQVAVGNR